MFQRLLFIFLFLFSSISFAQEEPSISVEENTNKEFPDEFPIESYGQSILKVFFLLALLIFFLGFSIWLIKRFFNRRMLAHSVGKTIQVLEKRILSPKSILYIIEVNGKKILISESQFEVRKIETIDLQMREDQ